MKGKIFPNVSGDIKGDRLTAIGQIVIVCIKGFPNDVVKTFFEILIPKG